MFSLPHFAFCSDSIQFFLFTFSLCFFFCTVFGGKRFVNMREKRQNRKRINRKVPSLAFLLPKKCSLLCFCSFLLARERLVVLDIVWEWNCRAAHDLVMCGNFIFSSIFLCVLCFDDHKSAFPRNLLLKLMSTLFAMLPVSPKGLVYLVIFCVIFFSTHLTECKVLVQWWFLFPSFFFRWCSARVGNFIWFNFFLFSLQHWDSAFFVNMMNKLMRCKWSAYRFFNLPSRCFYHRNLRVVRSLYHVVDVVDRLLRLQTCSTWHNNSY